MEHHDEGLALSEVASKESSLEKRSADARERLDAQTREIVAWHFDPKTGCPFWLDYATKLDWDPRTEIKCYDDLDKFEPFQDEWLRGGPVRRWVPKAYADKPISIFETGGSTGVPRVASASTTSASTMKCSAIRFPTTLFLREPTG